MAFKVNPDGSIEATTMEDALELQRRIHGGAPRLNLRNRESVRANGNDVAYDHDVFKKLRPHDGLVIDSDTMKDIVGAEAIGGVGPKLYHMKNRIPGLRDILSERKDDRGHTSWKVKFPG